jgi:hypothetical protein
MAAAYNERWPGRPQLHFEAGWLYGVWMIGNDYRNLTSFYGAYPRSLVERYRVTFEDNGPRILHLFSGSLPRGDYTRFDLVQEADVQGDAHELYRVLKRKGLVPMDLIYADPPYSVEDAKKYGTEMVDRRAIVRQCAQVLAPGGLLVWLDTQVPQYRKVDLKHFGTIAVIRSCNQRVRVVSVFRKVTSR